ncbi:IcmL-like protein [Legionella lansingensis]|uniref:IcmL-like protein n=1 Tax=Legionella lansingensis TaxID=45067 RepID=A0A0W0VFG4_9GAMM|nr:DotI/IcmL family type IV secretion protein [Legionella lansingensis]KTD18834.1 IcmL-like protein [Legionella lansingensis]SNV52865.1 IcmL-like protein [Legionella lansingensis]
MNKSMLYAGLIGILCTSTYAEDKKTPETNLTQTVAGSTIEYGSSDKENNLLKPKQVLASQGVTPPDPTGPKVPDPQGPQVPTPQGPDLPNTQSTQPVTIPQTQQGTTTTQGTTVPASQNVSPKGTQTPAQQGVTTPTAPPSTAPTVQSTMTIEQVNVPKIDCNYRIPAETTTVDQSLVLRWATKAAVQSFDFDYNTIDTQLSKLKACYTDLGWQGFNDALQKSGNLNAIKTQKLIVSSMLSGPMQITQIKDNQWKVNIPLQVVYQNDKEKLTQALMVHLVIGRKVSGDLGITQIIAMPRKVLKPSVPPVPTTHSTTTSSPTTTTTTTTTTTQP